jgi:hypothetical protein
MASEKRLNRNNHTIHNSVFNVHDEDLLLVVDHSGSESILHDKNAKSQGESSSLITVHHSNETSQHEEDGNDSPYTDPSLQYLLAMEAKNSNRARNWQLWKHFGE